MKMTEMERVDLKLYKGQMHALLCGLLIPRQIHPSREMSDHIHKHILNLACAPHPKKLDSDH